MTTVTECDGCRIRIGEFGELGMEGRCVDGSYDLPPGIFHWCQACAGIACKAVRDARLAGTQAGADEIITR